jgi:hypothetical protein
MSWVKHERDGIAFGKQVRTRQFGVINDAPFIFDHFAYGAGALNSHVPQNWVTTETGTGTPFAPGATGGTYLTGVTGGTTNNGEEVAGKGVLWVPSTMGGIVLECRAKFDGATTATDGDFYLGLNDAVTETNSLPYVVSAASALTTHAPTDGAFFAYTSIATSGSLFLADGNHIGMITSKADVDTVTAPSRSVVKDSEFHVYRLEIDAAGNCAFLIDGNSIGSVAVGLTPSVALTPYICAVAKNSHTNTATLDYLYVAAGSYL